MQIGRVSVYLYNTEKGSLLQKSEILENCRRLDAADLLARNLNGKLIIDYESVTDCYFYGGFVSLSLENIISIKYTLYVEQ
jgi:hypothetical protein